MDDFQKFIVTSRYCRWLSEDNRRETWEECVGRYVSYMEDRFKIDIPEIKQSILNREVFPSMRALMTAGPAADVDNTCLYNCAYVALEQIRSFSDVMYILCCGTGVGFSCEQFHTDKLPEIPQEIKRREDTVIKVADSRTGWADSFRLLLTNLYAGTHPTWNTDNVRPAGERLKTFGGRASGPEPLERLFKYVVNVFDKARGRKLKPIEVHDIVCLTGEIVIAGAVRRSALISLSDFHDSEMARAKSGAWWEASGHRSLANNSAVYDKKPSMGEFLNEWLTMYNSRSGERGICNRESLDMLATRAGRDIKGFKLGTNPCSEIILRPKQFCNLTEVVIKPDDDFQAIESKVISATILGTIQSACVDFPFLDSDWKDNCEEERLLGVSFTGIFDNKYMSTLGRDLEDRLGWLRNIAHVTNHEWANRLGISRSLSITCCKPSGTTSCVAGTSSGMHPRYSEYYIRRVRVDTKDPICQFMMDSDIPYEKCVMRPESTVVFSFPMKAPEGSVTQKELNPIDHLDLWLTYQKHWCDHKPSITVSYTDDSIQEIGQWVWDNWDWVSGISFLPLNDNVYEQAPFEAIDQDTYNELQSSMPSNLDWDDLVQYENGNGVEVTQTLACTGGACEVVDLVE
jgi:ribonucleoside-triphosphate reductase (thioredoxin)